MGKRIFVLLSFVTLILASSLPLEKAQAIKSIPDGGATYNDGYRAYKDARDVNSTVKSMWDNGRNGVNPTAKKGNLTFVRGGKNPNLYSMWNGKQLVYDVYAGKTNQSKKRAWTVIKSGGEHFFSFDGWAVNFGHHHHTKQNQATYIGLVNKNNLKEKHIFKARMLLNTNANEDLHYTGLRTCKNNEYDIAHNPAYANTPHPKHKKTSCNMNYNYTQFRAYIPLKDIFGDKNEKKEWAMYIIKRVENRIIYDQLILPYDAQTYNWEGYGKITMESGRNASQLRMLNSEVIKRKSARGGGQGWGDLGYFVPGKTYTRTGFNEERGVANWFRVYDNQTGYGQFTGYNYTPWYEDRWASSAYWEFTGNVATLSFEKTHAQVKVQHIDKTTSHLLKEEEKQVELGKNYKVKPKKKGYFTDSDGNEYLAVPHRNNQEFNGKITGNRTIKFYYKAIKDDPSEDKEIGDSSEGMADGFFSWELFKENSDEESKIKVINEATIEGNHYDVRNVKHTSSNNLFNEETDSSHEVVVDNLDEIKDKNIDFSFEYEYTNHYRDIYKCVDGVSKDDGYSKDYCFEWEFDERVPSWKDKHTHVAKWEKTILVDHEHSKVHKVSEEDDSVLSLTIGRDWVFNDPEDIDKEREYQEHLVLHPSDTRLQSQTYKDIAETIRYQTDFDNEFYVIDGDKYYFPNDLDENLKAEYENDTEYDYSKYKIPLRVEKTDDEEITFLTEDNFFVTDKTGFVFSLPHEETSENRIEVLAKEKFEEFTDEDYHDNVLTTPDEGSRYYLNIDLNGKQEPDTWYDDNMVLGKLGLSDVTVHYLQKLKFDNYLFGAPLDKPIVAEQRGSIVDDVDYKYSVTLTPEQIKELKELSNKRNNTLHSFRSLDIYKILNKIKEIIPSFPH